MAGDAREFYPTYMASLKWSRWGFWRVWARGRGSKEFCSFSRAVAFAQGAK